MDGMDGKKRTYLVTEGVDGHTKRSSQTEISELELALASQEQVLGFEVSMEHPVVVAEGDTLQALPKREESEDHGAR
jgi:hypothetical protein